MNPEKKSNMPTPVMPTLPIMPEMLERAMPVHVPQLEYNTTLYKGFKHNWKLKQLERATEREANVALNKSVMVRANLDCIEAITTFSTRLQTAFVALETQRKNFELESKMAEALLVEQQLKNCLMQTEAESAQLDLETKKKELGNVS